MKFGVVAGHLDSELSPPAREVWIEIRMFAASAARSSSPPAREVWIEIFEYDPELYRKVVTSREGGVD